MVCDKLELSLLALYLFASVKITPMYHQVKVNFIDIELYLGISLFYLSEHI